MCKALVLLAASWRLVEACSCGPSMPICTRIDQSTVLFIGDILNSNDDHTGTFAQLTLERVRVVEVFKGLPEGTKEVWLNPGSGTSCYGELSVGKRYLIDGLNVGKVSPEIADQSRNYRGDLKPLPA